MKTLTLEMLLCAFPRFSALVWSAERRGLECADVGFGFAKRGERSGLVYDKGYHTYTFLALPATETVLYLVLLCIII